MIDDCFHVLLGPFSELENDRHKRTSRLAEGILYPRWNFLIEIPDNEAIGVKGAEGG